MAVKADGPHRCRAEAISDQRRMTMAVNMVLGRRRYSQDYRRLSPSAIRGPATTAIDGRPRLDPGRDRSGHDRQGEAATANVSGTPPSRRTSGRRSATPAGLRVRVLARVPAPAVHVPFDSDPNQGDPAQRSRSAPPTASWCSSSRTGTGRACGLHLERGRHLMAAAVPVRDPVRALDGLPRLHPSRVRELYLRGMSTDEAVNGGSRARPEP